MKVKSESEVAQSCPTPSDRMDCSLSGSSVHGIFQQEYWSGVPSPSPHALLVPNKVKAKPVILQMLSGGMASINHYHLVPEWSLAALAQ